MVVGTIKAAATSATATLADAALTTLRLFLEAAGVSVFDAVFFVL